MGRRFEELDWAETAWGEVSLRRRRDPLTGRDVFEVKLGEEYLMSSQFTAAEEELARLGVDAVRGEALRVMVGGLGLGFTARAALADPRVADLVVVEALAPVIDWQRRRLLPGSAELVDDPRCRLVEDDFFALVRKGRWAEPLDVLLVDIDHTPDHLLREDHGDLYGRDGMVTVARMLRPGGVFGLWSDDPPDDAVVERMRSAFDAADAVVVDFPNPITGGRASNTVYLAVGPR